ncbi:MAG: hypothetical protein Q8J69_07725 [Sphingobacteriaceae bacterium]|nr:hypothetical protein [Sphingobacteriaceae bacterium]
MRQNIKLIGAFAALVVFVWWVRPWQRQPDLAPAYDRQIDSLQRLAQRFNAEAAEAWLAMQKAEAKADKMAEQVDSLQQAVKFTQAQHSQRIADIRTRPADSVMTTTLVLAECDSCCEVGFQVQLVNDAQAAEIMHLRAAVEGCQDAYTKKDSAALTAAEKFSISEKRNEQLEGALKKTTSWNNFWKTSTLVLALNELRRAVLR